MWKIAIGAVLALSLTAAGSASAATVDVSITKTAYAPSTVSLSTADTVKFTNNDTASHQVAFKAATGVTCSPSPFVLQPAQSGTCTFSLGGHVQLLRPDTPPPCRVADGRRAGASGDLVALRAAGHRRLRKQGHADRRAVDEEDG